MAEGWIKLHRALLENPLWKDCNSTQKVILITILLMVNFKPNSWIFEGEKIEVKAGEMITSLKSISEQCGDDVSIKNVRTALLKFEKFEFLASKSTNKSRRISIINWDTYQLIDADNGKQSGKQLASSGQAGGKQLATNKESKKDKTVKKVINKTLMPEDFKVNQTGIEKCYRLKLNDEQIKIQVKECYEYYYLRKTRFTDWQLVFKKWLDSDFNKMVVELNKEESGYVVDFSHLPKGQK